MIGHKINKMAGGRKQSRETEPRFFSEDTLNQRCNFRTMPMSYIIIKQN